MVEIENRENIDLTQTMEGVSHITKKRKKVKLIEKFLQYKNVN